MLKPWLPAVAVTLLAASLIPTNPATANTVEEPSTSTSVKPADLPSTGDSFVWTPERRRSAKPLDAPPGGRIAPSDAGPRSPGVVVDPAPNKSKDGGAAAVAVPYGAGKLYVRSPAGLGSCTAAIVSSPKANLIITAAHCLHGGPGGGWYSDVSFFPAYDNGPSRLGEWKWDGARVPNAWIDFREYASDQGFVTVANQNGHRLQDVAGIANGLAWDDAPDQWTVEPSWPGAAPYNGQQRRTVWGRTTASAGRAVLKNAAGNGASGAAWLRDLTGSQGAGWIWAVHSQGRGADAVAHPNGRVVKDMWDQVIK
ncbi:peptidase [Kribbella albertanoniae]|uniref:Trypsin-like serine protease n=1 Tax=Kribbella albertanoniae TaxID=1266829 RepID=A0A4R4Q382_9ACTN|nr:hypothetical protein [Kribbella albertanoniae]TDC29273.1 hypothetical protein E1261_16175 [Kribbella albertanoniae]